MSEHVRVIAHNGLRLRDSPRDGITLRVLAEGEKLEVLGRETWVRVRHGGQVGFVLEDFIEPAEAVKDGMGEDFNWGDSEPVDIFDFPPSDTIRGAPLRIDREFEPAMQGIQKLATASNIVVWITSSLREPYKPVPGAIVAPAQFSNHHVGHGIDMNLILGGRWFRSAELGRFDSLPDPIRAFLEGVQTKLDLRWGGTFSTPDPVHIDDGLNLRDRKKFDAKLATLWGVART